MTFHIQDNCRSADQRVHADENNEQGREAEEQQREGNTGGGNSVKNYKGCQISDTYQVTAGVREYFNVMLSSQLLYRQERQQYDQLVKQVVLENKIHHDARDAKCQIIQNQTDRYIWGILHPMAVCVHLNEQSNMIRFSGARAGSMPCVRCRPPSQALHKARRDAGVHSTKVR